jgi:hypothetical protein
MLDTTPPGGAAALTITHYQLVSEQAAAGTQAYLTYRADLVNPLGAVSGATATLTSLDPFTVRVVPGQGILNFSPVPANSQVTSSNTFTVIANPSAPLNFSKLQWSFQTSPAAPIANPGQNQTVGLGSTVALDSSGSLNPSGVGALTYDWKFTSRPPGTRAVLRFETSAAPTFVADAAGTYVIQLTVSNGTASSSASVSVTAF